MSQHKRRKIDDIQYNLVINNSNIEDELDRIKLINLNLHKETLRIFNVNNIFLNADNHINECYRLFDKFEKIYLKKRNKLRNEGRNNYTISKLKTLAKIRSLSEELMIGSIAYLIGDKDVVGRNQHLDKATSYFLLATSSIQRKNIYYQKGMEEINSARSKQNIAVDRYLEIKRHIKNIAKL